jgi:fatty acid desaturase
MIQDHPATSAQIEWPTLLLIVATYMFWAIGTWAWSFAPLLSILLTGWFIAQFSSLQHEILHGHPFRTKALNEALVFPALILLIPYGRFRDTHLQHHWDPDLTDPYDDPESNYVDPAVWAQMSRTRRWIMRINNTLLGRMTLGLAYGMPVWLLSEARLIAKGRPGVVRDWILNALGWLPVLAWLAFVDMPLWAYSMAAFLGLSLLRIRTFLEHRAHETCRARTVIIEDRGPLSLLFLNNNFHAVHHMHPNLAWYELPARYAAHKDHYQRHNDGYVYTSYTQIFARYFFTAKDPVAHPIWPMRKSDGTDS